MAGGYCDPNNGGCIDYSMGSYPHTCDSLISLCDPAASGTQPGDWLNFLDCTNNQVPIDMINDWYKTQINMFGAPLKYYVANFNKSINKYVIRGVDHRTPFDPPVDIKGYVNPMDININSIPGGYIDTSTFTMLINKEQYKEIFGEDAQPKAGDLFQIPCLSLDFYQISFRDEQHGPNAQLINHYNWEIIATKYIHTKANEVEEQQPDADRTNDAEAIEEESNEIYDYQEEEEKVYGGKSRLPGLEDL